MGAPWKDEKGDVILVAVDGTKEITDYALEWAIRNAIKPGDTLILLAILPLLASPSRSNHPSVYQFLACAIQKWGFSQENKGVDQAELEGRGVQEVQKISAACVHMMKQLCSANQVTQVETRVETGVNAQTGSVAVKAREFEASWVILDRRLKKEAETCLKELICNIIVIDHAIPKVLRLLNSPSHGAQHAVLADPVVDPSKPDTLSGVYPIYKQESNNGTTPTSSHGLDSHGSNTDVSWSLSSGDRDRADPQEISSVASSRSSKLFLDHHRSDVAGGAARPEASSGRISSCTQSQRLDSVSNFREECGVIAEKTRRYSGLLQEKPLKAPAPARRSVDSLRSSAPRSSVKDSKNRGAEKGSLEPISQSPAKIMDRTSSIRKAMSLSIKQPPTPPPLCSVCQHNAPVFGKRPRKFAYRELEIATEGFSPGNFLAEGGYGPVYKGVLPDGQVVAVKQHRMLSAQGASEFCSEVEVLSCAQHRNLVMLVGYCMEKEWLLVYEFACNGSLDKHLYGNRTKEVMEWENRLKVAVGAARGLRYLHEDCRVGCIVHRDLRPNNILLTHDFEAMVGDFGLARWQVNGQSAEETRIIGTFGYLAPEYTQTGQITEKADVYAFGVLLMELLSGQRAIDLSRSPGQQYLPVWGRPLLLKRKIREIMDPRLEGNYTESQVECMMYAASLCISHDAGDRPRMSKVLRILEGDIPISRPSQSGQLEHSPLQPQQRHKSRKPSNNPITKEPRRNSHHGKLEWPETQLLSPSHWDTFASEEYRAYLQGSLANFIHKLKAKPEQLETIVASPDDRTTTSSSPSSLRLFY